MTLPFISYGGSSMLSYAIIFGTVINFTKNEKSPIGHPS
jgi:cell division protein FtsW (lipid II flippase)